MPLIEKTKTASVRVIYENLTSCGLTLAGYYHIQLVADMIRTYLQKMLIIFLLNE